MSNCGQQFINTRCGYINDSICSSKCELHQLKQQYNQLLQQYFTEYNNYLQALFGQNATDATKTNAISVIKPKVISLNTQLNGILTKLKDTTTTIQTNINNQEVTITSMNTDIINKNKLINTQLQLIKQKEDELQSKHKMISSGIERNNYKRNVIYLFIVIIVIILIVIVNILLKKN